MRHASFLNVRQVDRGSERAVRLGFGLLFLWASGIHVGLASADPQVYATVADGAWFPGIRDAWAEIFMAHPRSWGLAVSAGELAIAMLLLSGGRLAPLGRAAAVGFHVGLMLLGWGYWMWSVPALAVLLAPRPAPRRPIIPAPRTSDPAEEDWPYPTLVAKATRNASRSTS